MLFMVLLYIANLLVFVVCGVFSWLCILTVCSAQSFMFLFGFYRVMHSVVLCIIRFCFPCCYCVVNRQARGYLNN